MAKGMVIGVVVVAVVVVAGILFMNKSDVATTSISPSPSASTSLNPLSSSTSTLAASTTTDATQTVTITVTDSGFDPANITIKKGDTVSWKNSSSKDIWPASGMHPTHLVYPEQNSCFAGVFTGCHVAAGGTVSMKFNLVGSWGYHDHLMASHFGKITVTE